MKKKINPLWGGRFKADSSALLKKINNSIDFDYLLAKQDIKVCLVYAKSLKKAGIISSAELNKILNGLNKISDSIKKNKFLFNADYEDIHMNIEMALKEDIGDLAGKLHTGKSRNDQVATDLKIWIRENVGEIIKLINVFQKILIKKSEENLFNIMPGFTHLQNAQPISVAHYFLAFFEMLERDKQRFKNLLNTIDECPLGSGALVGTNFYRIDRKFISKSLGFNKPTNNSLDSVSDRDFAIDFLSASSILGMHLSRMSEDLIIWCSSSFSFISFSDALSTGSSIMPQKKNPDAVELVRAKTSILYSNLMSLLTTMKGLPMGYSKDLQEDKIPVFKTNETIQLMLQVMCEVIKDININKKKMYDSSKLNFSTATDFADWIVMNLGYSFRQAHHIAGRAVVMAEKKKCTLFELELDDLKKLDLKISKKIYNFLDPHKSVENKKSEGGTAFSEIKKAIKKAKTKID